MSETTTERVGKYDLSVAFCTPAKDEDPRQRRIAAITAWLLSQWEARHKEDEHGDARAAG
jgi:hypothetical protein